MRNVLVIGGTGKTGRELLSALSAVDDVSVRSASRHSQQAEAGNYTSIHFDWENPSTWAEAASQADAIYIIKPKTPDPAATINEFLHRCRTGGKVVLLSEIAAERQEPSADELRVEKVVEAGPIRWTILRPNWFMQNFAAPAFYGDAIRNKHSIEVPTGGKSVSFVDTRDIAEVAAAALLSGAHDGRHYTLTGPQALTFADALSAIGEECGYPIRHVDPPLEEHLKDGMAGASHGVINYFRRVYKNIQNGFDSIISDDVEQVLGKKPRRFSAFVKEHRAAWM